jgi:hypothetical protein
MGKMPSIVTARVVRDNSGAYIELPVLLTGSGPFRSLLDYQLCFWAKSRSWHKNLVRSVRLLIDYAEANVGAFKTERELFAAFSSCLYSGTVGPDGLDASGLYWRPLRRSWAAVVINMLTVFSKWHSREHNIKPLNPLRDATSSEAILQWAGWAYRNNENFLGHTESKTQARERLRLAPWIRGLSEPKVYDNEPKAFPEESFSDLILNGFVRRPSLADPIARLSLRDVLITIMQHGAGVRASECFHLWMSDVTPYPLDPTVALIRIHHPGEGDIAWTDELGNLVKSNRAAYLASLGLTPRNLLGGSRHAGWKNPALDEKWYMELKWFPQDFGRLFMKLWEIYLIQVQPIQRNHPYAWISFGGTNPGGMYSEVQYTRAHERAVQRIGLVSAKYEGTTSHGHRHAYGLRLRRAGVQPELRQRCMHHGSLASQLVYTAAQGAEVNTEITAATSRIDANLTIPVTDLLGRARSAMDNCEALTEPYKRLYK